MFAGDRIIVRGSIETWDEASGHTASGHYVRRIVTSDDFDQWYRNPTRPGFGMIEPIRAWAITTHTSEGGFRHQRRTGVDSILGTSGVGCHQSRGLYEAQPALLVEFPLLGLPLLPGGHATPASAIIGDGRRLRRRRGSTRRAVRSRRGKEV